MNTPRADLFLAPSASQSNTAKAKLGMAPLITIVARKCGNGVLVWVEEKVVEEMMRKKKKSTLLYFIPYSWGNKMVSAHTGRHLLWPQPSI